MSTKVHQAVETVTTSNELDVLFGPLFDKYFKGENQVVLKSSAVTTTDASNKRQQQPDSTSSTSTLATTVTANGNFDLKPVKEIILNLTVHKDKDGRWCSFYSSEEWIHTHVILKLQSNHSTFKIVDSNLPHIKEPQVLNKESSIGEDCGRLISYVKQE
ncbi:hypothetical protein Tco_0478127 [Tanacetum coccineum]